MRRTLRAVHLCVRRTHRATNFLGCQNIWVVWAIRIRNFWVLPNYSEWDVLISTVEWDSRKIRSNLNFWSFEKSKIMKFIICDAHRKNCCTVSFSMALNHEKNFYDIYFSFITEMIKKSNYCLRNGSSTISFYKIQCFNMNISIGSNVFIRIQQFKFLLNSKWRSITTFKELNLMSAIFGQIMGHQYSGIKIKMMKLFFIWMRWNRALTPSTLKIFQDPISIMSGSNADISWATYAWNVTSIGDQYCSIHSSALALPSKEMNLFLFRKFSVTKNVQMR